MSKFGLALGLSVGACAALGSPVAQAHFLLNAPKNWWSQLADGSPQKTAPCGNEAASGTSASKVITNVQPGQTLHVQVEATVPHPGWYRISLKQGASATQTTSSLPDPPTPKQCTPAFIDNPVWSPTQPVLADKLGLPAGSTSTTTTQSGSPTFDVTIPANATCTTASPCTLQVLMFMTDHPAGSCNYHHCADIAFASGGAGDAGHGGTAGASGGTGPGSGGAAGGSGGRGAAGASGASGGSIGTGGTGTGGSSATPTGGTTGTGGSTTNGTGGQLATGGSSATGGTSGGAGAPGGDGGSDGGCSCSVTRHPTRGAALGGGVLVAAALLAARRKRRKRRAGSSLR